MGLFMQTKMKCLAQGVKIVTLRILDRSLLFMQGMIRSVLIQQVFFKLIRDESAQGTTEYILVLSVSVVGASQLIKQIIQSIDRGVLRLGGDLEKDLKTGRAPVSVWRN